MPAGKSSHDPLHRLFPVGDRGSPVNQKVSRREPLLPAALLDPSDEVLFGPTKPAAAHSVLLQAGPESCGSAQEARG